jgi:hypothetical protein
MFRSKQIVFKLIQIMEDARTFFELTDPVSGKQCYVDSKSGEAAWELPADVSMYNICYCSVPRDDSALQWLETADSVTSKVNCFNCRRTF